MQTGTEQGALNFDVRVRRLHAATGKTWADLAAEMRVSRTMLHYYRNGQHPPDAQVLYRLGEAERQAGFAEPGSTRCDSADEGSLDVSAHARWLRGALQRQREVVASAQRHLREIERWVRDAELELPEREPGARVFHGDETTDVHSGSAVDDRFRLRDIDTVSLPIFGYLPAGWPHSSEGVSERHAPRSAPVRKGRFPDGAFGLEVRGDSMNAARPEPISHGDTVVLVSPEQREPKGGDIVAALIDGETCLKRLASEHGQAHLVSESHNPAFRAIYPAQELVIQGVMVGKL